MLHNIILSCKIGWDETLHHFVEWLIFLLPATRWIYTEDPATPNELRRRKIANQRTAQTIPNQQLQIIHTGVMSLESCQTQESYQTQDDAEEGGELAKLISKWQHKQGQGVPSEAKAESCQSQNKES